MTLRPPTERPLPNKEQLLDRVLSSEPEPRRNNRRNDRRRRVLIPIVAAASVAAIAAAALLLPPALKSGEPAVTPTPKNTEMSIDLGPLSKAQIDTFLKHCWFWNGTAQKVVHTTRIKSGWHGGEEWTMAMIGHSVGGNGVAPGDNRVTGCSGRPNGSTTGTSTDQGFQIENFITTTSPMRYDDSFRPEEGTFLYDDGSKIGTSVWIRVPKQVARVRQRLVVNGEAQQWFSSKTDDGLSYVQTWLDKRPKDTTKIHLEVQFLTSSGQLVKIPGSNGLTSTLPISGGVRPPSPR